MPVHTVIGSTDTSYDRIAAEENTISKKDVGKADVDCCGIHTAVQLIRSLTV